MELIAEFCGGFREECRLYFDNYVFEALHVFGLAQGLENTENSCTRNRNQLLDTLGG